MKKHVLALVPLLMASAAVAEPATEDGAAHLTEVFQTYLGTTEGLVTVAANGDAYDLTLDAAPLIAMGKDAGVTGSVTPIKLSLTDNGDGTWGVSMDQAISIAMSVPNALDLKEDVASQTFEGTFDEKLMAFSAMKGAFSGVKVVETIQTPNAAPTTATVGLDKGTFEGTGVAGAAGGADIGLTMTASGLTEAMDVSPGPGEPAMPITLKAEGLSEEIKGTGFMFDGIFKTAAWIVAHPDQASREADVAGFKTIITGAIPFFGNMNATGKVTMLSVETPMGTAGLQDLGFAVEANGAVAEGKVREAFTLSGLTLPAGLVPAWAEPILPKKLSLDVQVTDFDAAAGLAAALETLGAAGGMTDATAENQKLQAAFLPKGTVTVTLNPGSLAGDGYEVTYEGALVAGPNTPAPTGTAKVTLTGADKLQAALQSAPDDMKAQALGGFGMAQGMAKKDGDKLVWEIDASKPGALSVNGIPMMGGN